MSSATKTKEKKPKVKASDSAKAYTYNLPSGPLPARDFFRSIIAEVPEEKILQYDHENGHITREALLQSIDDDTELAKRFITDMMRITRDMMIYR